MKKFLLVDGNLLLFKSFYAAWNSSGQTKNNMTAHFFISSLLNVINNLNTDYIFVAFDAKGGSWRSQYFSEYKAGRTSPDPFIYEQKKLIIEFLELTNICWLEQIGDEADDLIATIALRECDENFVYILSDDKDLLQLVDENIFILSKNPKTKLIEETNVDNFYEKYEIKPSQMVDFKAISGDPSDNLKGVEGVGPKTTIKLLSEYEDLDGIYDNLNKLTPGLKDKFIKFKEQSYLCQKLATLNPYAIIDFNQKDMILSIKNNIDDFLDRNSLNRVKNLYNQLIKKTNK